MADGHAIETRATDPSARTRGMGLKPRLVIAFLFVSLLIAVTGVGGLLFVKQIGSAVETVANVSSPLVDEAGGLVARVQDISLSLSDASKLRSSDGIEAAKEKLAQQRPAVVGAFDRIEALVTAGRVTVDIAGARTQGDRFLTQAGKVIAALAQQVEHAEQARQQLQEVDLELSAIVALARTLGKQSELNVRRSAAVDPAPVQAAMSVDLLHDLYRLQIDMFDMRDAARGYLAESDPAKLGPLKAGFEKKLASVNTISRQLRARASGDLKTTVMDIRGKLIYIQSITVAQGGLFGLHADAVGSEIVARAANERLRSSFAALREALGAVSARAAKINAGAVAGTQRGVTTATLSSAAIILVGIAAALLVGFMVARSLAGPLTRMTEAMTRLAAGQLDITVPELGRNDEIGAMASSVQVFKENAEKVARMTSDLQTREHEAKDRAESAARAAEDFGEVFAALASGDFKRRVEGEFDGGFARLKEDANAMAARLERMTEEVQEQIDRTSLAVVRFGGMFEAMAGGDLRHRVEGEFDPSFAMLKADTNAMADRLAETVIEANRVSTNISAAVTQVAAGGQDLSERSEQQASTLEETAASMEQLTTTVRLNADNAQQASSFAATARDTAVVGGEIVTETAAAMHEIEQSSQKISEITGMIDEIAFQTNLLALNASVEAARAGDAGKGFGVVASEVRNLAQRTADSSKEIQALISASGAQVRSGVELVTRTGDTLAEIVSAVMQTADIVAEIATANTEQSQSLEEVNTAMAQLDDMTQRNAAMVQEFASAARSMEEEVNRLVALMGFFDTGANPGLVGRDAAAADNPIGDMVTGAERRLGSGSGYGATDSAENLGMTSSHVFSLWTNINEAVAQAAAWRGMTGLTEEIQAMQPHAFSDKAPAHVLENVHDFRRKLDRLRAEAGLGATKVYGNGNGVIEPSVVFLNSGHVLSAMVDWLSRIDGQRCDESHFFRRRKVAGKTPSDVFGLVDLAHRRIDRILALGGDEKLAV